MITPVLVKVAPAAGTDKQVSVTQPRNCLFFTHVAILFGVPSQVARGDSETIFNMWFPRLPRRTSPVYLSTGRRAWRAKGGVFYGSGLVVTLITSAHISLVSHMVTCNWREAEKCHQIDVPMKRNQFGK